MAMMVKMSTAWALSLLVLALSGCSATCRHDGRFWDGCNWCFCRDHYLVGCTNMACLSLPREVFQIDPNRPTIGPPQREGLFAYKPGRGVVVDPSGWPCQMGSSWLESGGCVRCNCINKMIKCRDSGMCLNGQPVSNELMPPQTEYVRRRRDNAPAAATPSPAAPVAEPAVEPTAATATAATESTTSTAWAATEPAVTGGAESTVAPAEGAGQATPAAEAANATRAPPPATTTAQNTVVKDRSCRSGSTWEEDCNSCWCLDNGRAACTTNSCEPPPPLTLGAPGSPAATAGGIAAGPGVHGAAPGAAPAVALSAAVVPAVAAPAPGVPPAAAPAAVEATVPSSTPSSAAVTAAVPITEPAAVPEASGAGSAAGSRRKRRVVLVSA